MNKFWWKMRYAFWMFVDLFPTPRFCWESAEAWWEACERKKEIESPKEAVKEELSNWGY